MSLELIIAIVGLGGSVGAIFIALRKAPFENRNLDASASKGYLEALKLADERMSKVEETARKLETRVAMLEEENEALKEWAERLTKQVRSLGGNPVKLKCSEEKI